MDTIDTVISVFTLFSIAKILRAPIIIERADGAKRDLIVKVTLACTYPLTPFSLTIIDTKYSLLIISNPRFLISQVLLWQVKSQPLQREDFLTRALRSEVPRVGTDSGRAMVQVSRSGMQ